jgi:hypothetical protein
MVRSSTSITYDIVTQQHGGNIAVASIVGKRQALAAYRFGGLECMLLGPGEGGLMSMIG